jgi:DNA-binding NtrC family response regulator
MRIPSDDDSEFGSAPGHDSDISEVDKRGLDRFLGRLSGEGCMTLLLWARRRMPDLLHEMIVSFLTRASSSELKGTAAQFSLPETSSATAAPTKPPVETLRAIERQHIARVIAESPTLEEAASRLGVTSSALWRKRKLYGLRSDTRLNEEPH